jgi:hypothetical protein
MIDVRQPTDKTNIILRSTQASFVQKTANFSNTQAKLQRTRPLGAPSGFMFGCWGLAVPLNRHGREVAPFFLSIRIGLAVFFGLSIG